MLRRTTFIRKSQFNNTYQLLYLRNMKKLSLLSFFFVALFAVTSCKKEENNATPTENPAGIAQEQKAVGFYLSGTWCGPCGLYGKPAMANVEKANPTKFVVVACHLNGGGGATDPYNTQDANSLASAWAVTGVPTCAIGGAGQPAQKIGGGTGMESGMTTQINTVLSKTASANSSVDVAVDASNKLTIKTKTKFFETSADAYSMSVYVVENNIKGRQYVSGTGWNENATHNNVLRKSVASSVVGEDLITGVTANQEVSKNFETTLDAAWSKDNLEVVVVLWKTGGSGKLIINGTSKNLK